MTGAAAGMAFLAGAAFGPWAVVAVACGFLLLRLADADCHHVYRAAALVAIAALVGAWRGQDSRTSSTASIPPPPWIDAADAVRGTIASDPTSDGRWQRFIVEATASQSDGAWIPARGRLCVMTPAQPVAGQADSVWLVGTTRAVEDLAVQSRTITRARGCVGDLFATAWQIDRTGRGWRRVMADARVALSASLRHAASGDAGALLSGLVTGDDHALSARRSQAFNRTGTTHITAVSGSNVAFVAGAIGAVGGIGGRRRRLWPIVILVGVWSYAILVGLEPPVARAAVVATGAMVAGHFGRRADLVTLVILAGAMLVAINPPVLWSLSFQLSFAASLALSAVLPYLHPVGPSGWLRAGLTVAVVAQMATLPVSLSQFENLSLVSVPANLLIGPLVAVAFPVAAVAAPIGLISPLLGDAITTPAAYIARVIFVVVDTLGGSQNSVAAIGTVPRLAELAVLAGALSAVIAGSAEGRQWVHRMRRVWPAKDMAIGVTAVVIGLLVVALLGIARR